jgi:hypothetical protein
VRPGRIEPGERLGQVGHDLIGPDDHQVEVRYQGERATALTGAVIQDDGPGLGDRDRAAGHDSRHLVEFGRGQRRGIPGHLDAAGHPFRREPGRHHDGPGHGAGPGRQHPGHGVSQTGPGHALHHGPVVGDALGEQVRDVAGVVRPQVRAGQRRVLRVHVGRAGPGAEGTADPGQHLVAAHRRVLAHQARNDSGGGAGASRVSVQPLSGGGSRRMRPDRPTTARLAAAARCAAPSRRGERSTRLDS